MGDDILQNGGLESYCGSQVGLVPGPPLPQMGAPDGLDQEHPATPLWLGAGRFSSHFRGWSLCSTIRSNRCGIPHAIKNMTAARPAFSLDGHASALSATNTEYLQPFTLHFAQELLTPQPLP